MYSSPAGSKADEGPQGEALAGTRTEGCSALLWEVHIQGMLPPAGSCIPATLVHSLETWGCRVEKTLA